MNRLVIGLIVALLAGAAMADGKFYSDRVAPGIPYQRAFLTFDGQKQTLTLESKFEAKEGERFGWVIPVPALPEISSPDLRDMQLRYGGLEFRTRPVVIESGHLVLGAILLLLVVWLVLLVRRGRVVSALVVVVVTGFLVAVAFPSYQGIEVVKEERVGPYDAKVIRGDSSAEVIAWLKEGGFRFDERDRAAIDGYVARKWLFVAAKLDAGAKGAAHGVMVPPLMLGFAVQQPVYPLALTATAGQPVEIVLYVNAPWRADAGGRLPLHYAGEDRRGGYLTKFRGVMTPEQMREDLVLRPAESNAAYRRWEFRW